MYVIEFLHTEKIAAIDVCWHLLNAYGEQIVNLSTVMQWWQATFWADLHSSQNMKWSELWLGHQCKSADYDKGIMYGVRWQLQCHGNDINNIGISQTRKSFTCNTITSSLTPA